MPELVVTALFGSTVEVVEEEKVGTAEFEADDGPASSCAA
jgi:hypothetical protein